MKRIVCLLQEHMFPDARFQQLSTGCKKIFAENYSDEQVEILPMIMKSGYFYSERKLSEAAVLMVEVNEDISKDKREELMTLYSDFLMNEFDISPLDSVITIADSSWVQEFAMAQMKRYDPDFLAAQSQN